MTIIEFRGGKSSNPQPATCNLQPATEPPRERPILFKDLMVQAINKLLKTQTRRPMDPQWPADVFPHEHSEFPGLWIPYTKDGRVRNDCQGSCKDSYEIRCPYGSVGDRLYVKETCYILGHWYSLVDKETNKVEWHFVAEKAQAGLAEFRGVQYLDNPPEKIAGKKEKYAGETGWFKRPSIFMPRWASRILLEITDVRAQRLQDITEQDALAEGIYTYEFKGARGYCAHPHIAQFELTFPTAREAFAKLWNSINAKRGFPFASNPWVFALTFRLVNPPVTITTKEQIE